VELSGGVHGWAHMVEPDFADGIIPEWNDLRALQSRLTARQVDMMNQNGHTTEHNAAMKTVHDRALVHIVNHVNSDAMDKEGGSIPRFATVGGESSKATTEGNLLLNSLVERLVSEKKRGDVAEATAVKAEEARVLEKARKISEKTMNEERAMQEVAARIKHVENEEKQKAVRDALVAASGTRSLTERDMRRIRNDIMADMRRDGSIGRRDGRNDGRRDGRNDGRRDGRAPTMAGNLSHAAFRDEMDDNVDSDSDVHVPGNNTKKSKRSKTLFNFENMNWVGGDNLTAKIPHLSNTGYLWTLTEYVKDWGSIKKPRRNLEQMDAIRDTSVNNSILEGFYKLLQLYVMQSVDSRIGEAIKKVRENLRNALYRNLPLVYNLRISHNDMELLFRECKMHGVADTDNVLSELGYEHQTPENMTGRNNLAKFARTVIVCMTAEYRHLREYDSEHIEFTKAIGRRGIFILNNSNGENSTKWLHLESGRGDFDHKFIALNWIRNVYGHASLTQLSEQYKTIVNDLSSGTRTYDHVPNVARRSRAAKSRSRRRSRGVRFMAQHR